MNLTGLTYFRDKGLAKFEVIFPGSGGRIRRRETVAAKMRIHECGKQCRRNCTRCGQPEIDEADMELRFLAWREEKLTGKKATPSNKITFEGWVKANWSGVITADMKPHTARTRLSTVETHLLPEFGPLRFAQIDSNRLEDFRAGLRLKRHGKALRPLSNATINGIMNLLHSILSKASKRKVLAVMPEFPASLKAVTPMLELSAEEERAFLDAFDDRSGYLALFDDQKVRGSVSPEYGEVLYSWFRSSKPVFVIALHTGLRRGDLLRLEWSAIDFKQKLLKITTAKASIPVFIPLSPSAVEALLECKNRKLASSRFVFTQMDGDKYSVTTFRRHFAKAKKLAGIKRRFRAHDMRHTAGSKMASAGVPLQVIAKVLGHSTIRMSERYARPDQHAVQQIVGAMER